MASRNRLALNVTRPPRSSGPLTALRDSVSFGTRKSTTAPSTTLNRNTERQPPMSTSTPAIGGPSARPAPNAVPRIPKALARAGPSKVAARVAAPAVRMPAEPTPCTALATSTSTMLPARPATSDIAA
jgi:hypothetical protein